MASDNFDANDVIAIKETVIIIKRHEFEEYFQISLRTIRNDNFL